MIGKSLPGSRYYELVQRQTSLTLNEDSDGNCCLVLVFVIIMTIGANSLMQRR